MVRGTRIDRVVQESSNIRTFYFKDRESIFFLPGQFAMVWLPEAGEFPMSLFLSGRGVASIGVKSMGEGSRKLYECKKNDFIGIRGPYGNSFVITNKIRRALLVGGGTGVVPMIVLARELARRRVKIRMIIGAKRKAELPFLRIASAILGRKNLFPSTDDGSLGFHGLATDQAGEILKGESFNQIYACGPEKMMSLLLNIAKRRKIPVQFSLERIMKCGIGICGSCTIGDYVLCKDGPVLNSAQLPALGSEFGHMHRDMSGKLCPI